jgi:hypothetical protein
VVDAMPQLRPNHKRRWRAMRCHIEFNVNGIRGQAVVEAEDSVAGLLLWLETLPQSAAVKAIVRVLLPAETVQ